MSPPPLPDTDSIGRPVPPDSLQAVWLDRDLSWLDFNARVLAQAGDPRTPLLERAKFLAIYTSNLDEFFMKRIAVLREELTPARIAFLEEIRAKIDPQLAEVARCFREDLVPGLAEHGVYLRHWEQLTKAQREQANHYFDTQVSAALTPLVIDPSQPFPFLSNLSTSLAFLLHDPQRSEDAVARVKVPSVLKQWIPLTTDTEPGEVVYVRLHELIRENIPKLYRGMWLSAPTVFRLTRDAEVELNEDRDENLRDLIRETIRQRRFEPVIRLEFAPGADPAIRNLVQDRFHLLPVDVYDVEEELDYTTLFEIASLKLPQLRDAPWSPLTPPELDEDDDLFAEIRNRDILVHHPYESFDDSVERFISDAADDPQTVSIKMTVYRVGEDTPFVRSLVRAAEAGKQVACVIEVKARFDEERNLHWAAELEKAGAHVTFGIRGLKTHAKMALVVRKEAECLRSYVHVGTGNYHVRTARLYSDCGLLTCDPEITADVVSVFHYLTGRAEAPDCRHLLVAPNSMRPRFVELIYREISNHQKGKPSRIVAKMNQLQDPEIMLALCDASRAGVPVDLLIRGFCCLRAGVKGYTENIRIRSVIGRFLEHSRIFHFAAGEADPERGEFYIGSADWMYRNLSRRVEVVTPIYDAVAKAKLWAILDASLRDQRQAWVMDADGEYRLLQLDRGSEAPADGPERLGTHEWLMRFTRKQAEGALAGRQGLEPR